MSGIIETLIGSLAGFLLGILAFSIQQNRQAKEEREALNQSGLDSLRRLMLSATQNIEALIEFIIDMEKPIYKDSKTMENYLNNYYSHSSIIEKDILKIIMFSKEIQENSLKLSNFYHSLPNIYVMPAPDYSEFSIFFEKMPNLTTFQLRASSMMNELNSRIQIRNELLVEYQKEIYNDLHPERVIYFLTMLTDHGIKTHDLAENAYLFYRAVYSQSRNFLKYYANSNYFTYRINDKFLKELPNPREIPSIMDNIKYFSKENTDFF